MKALIKVGYSCNEHCSFCHTQDVRHIDAAASEVEQKIRRAAQLGHTMVVLSGGEATIRPELVKWASMISDLGMGFGLVTNGLMLAYPDLVKRLLERRLEYVYMSLHGDAKVHNSLVRRQSFDEAIAALQNLTGRGLDLTINCVVTTRNVAHLRSLVDQVIPFADANVKFSLVEPKGGASHEFVRLVPRVAEAAAAVADAIVYGRSAVGDGGPRFTHGGFPLCLLPGLEGDYDDLRTHRYWSMIEVGEDDFFPVDDKNKLCPPSTCVDCSLRGPCPGLFRAYHDKYGADELRPRRDGPRSNSFDYVYEGIYEGLLEDDSNGCPLLRGGVTPWDRGRHLLVRHGGRLGRFRALSRDFDDEEIENIKHCTGQVYVDASKKPAPNDFARDLVKLERSSMCGPCPERDTCTGIYEPVLEDVFTEDDSQLLAIIRELEGSVLDVGCGEGRYTAQLESRAAQGAIRYHAIDPDAAAIASLQRSAPSADARVGTLDVLGPREMFDTIMFLRSWNHLPNPAAAVERSIRHLRPGGTLLIVDNVAFGLARTPAQTRRARGSRAGWEHYRNDDAETADRRAARPQLQLVERRDVGPHTSNQWLLAYRRTKAGSIVDAP